MRLLHLCVALVLMAALSNGFAKRSESELEHLETILVDEIARELAEENRNTAAETKKVSATRGPCSRSLHRYHNGGKSQRVNKMEEQMVEADRREEELLSKIENNVAMNEVDEAIRELVSLSSRQLSLFDSSFCTLEGIPDCDANAIYRTIDGTCNNLNNKQLGMADSLHNRLLGIKHEYNNKVWGFKTRSDVKDINNVKLNLPDPRVISESVHKAAGANVDLTETGHTMFDFAWGQFLVHDVISTPELPINANTIDCCVNLNNFQCKSIIIGPSDTFFDPGYCMEFIRSDIRASCENDPTTGQSFANQINEHTSFVDGSVIYGNSETKLNELRTKVGGLLYALNDDKPPEDTSGKIPCVDEEPGYCYKCGDHRANVIPSLAMLHAAFVAHHNYIAGQLHTINPTWEDEQLFQTTRKIIGAILQHITYTEFLPSILNATVIADNGLTPSATLSGAIYKTDVNPTFSSIAALAMRYGHSAIPSMMKLYNDQYVPDDATNDVFNVADMYQRTKYLTYKYYHGDTYLARSLATDTGHKIDRFVEDSGRNLMFKEENASGAFVESYDIAALNIHRGRDWGTPGYYAYYGDTYCGIGNIDFVKNQPVDWTQMAHHSNDVVDLFKALYAHPRDVDAFTGLVSETRMSGSVLGPTSNCIIAREFQRMKEGDRFFYENLDSTVGFSAAQFNEIKKITLGKVLCERFDIAQMQENVFETVSASNPRQPCSALGDIVLTPWDVANE